MGNGFFRCFNSYFKSNYGKWFFWILAINRKLTYFNASGKQILYLVGAQLEEGSYATSYIPTSGSAVTRVADSCSQTGARWCYRTNRGGFVCGDKCLK